MRIGLPAVYFKTYRKKDNLAEATAVRPIDGNVGKL